MKIKNKITNNLIKTYNLDQQHKSLFCIFKEGQKNADPEKFTNVKKDDVISIIIESDTKTNNIDYHLIVHVTDVDTSIFFHDLEYLIIPDTADVEDEAEYWDVHYSTLDPSSIPRYRYLKLGVIEDFPEYTL